MEGETNKKRNRETFLSVNSNDTASSSKLNSTSLVKKKEKSKVSLKLSQAESSLLGVDEYQELIKEDAYESDHSLSDLIDKNLNKIQQTKQDIDVTVNFLIKLEHTESLYSIKLLVAYDTIIADLIRLSVMKFNDEKFILSIDSKKIGTFLLKEKFNDYSLKPSRKNNYPKLDLPSFCREVIIGDTSMSVFSLIVKPESIMLIKPPAQGCFSCRSCSLL